MSSNSRKQQRSVKIIGPSTRSQQLWALTASESFKDIVEDGQNVSHFAEKDSRIPSFVSPGQPVPCSGKSGSSGST